MNAGGTVGHSHLRPSALTYFQNKPLSLQDKWELTLSVAGTAVPAQVAEATSSEYDSSNTTANRTMGRQQVTRNVDRGMSTWLDDYIKPTSVYHDELFSQRIRVPNCLFTKLVQDLGIYFPNH